jgi:hypothetical protein
LDTLAQTEGLNTLYDQMWHYDNLFQPVMRLREKVRFLEWVIRRWDTAQTPPVTPAAHRQSGNRRARIGAE